MTSTQHRSERAEREYEADICIIGAGPAGLALAGTYYGKTASVILIDSGSRGENGAVQDLNRGRSLGGLAEPGTSRYRAIGGTTWLWNTPIAGTRGAKYAPLDPWDFRAWPFGRTELDPYYREAQVLAELGPFAYNAHPWFAEGEGPLQTGPAFGTAVYQFGTADPWRRLPDRLRGAPNIRILDQTTVIGLTLAGSERIGLVRAATAEGHSVRIRPGTVIFAMGAIENARALLLMTDGPPAVQRAGRCLMEHPRDTTLVLNARSRRAADRLVFYDQHRAREGTVIGGRLAVGSALIEAENLPNAYVTLLPRRRLSLVTLRMEGGYGWSAGWRRPRTFQVLINLEQRPKAENRVVLDRETDRYGVPRVALHWQYHDRERRQVDRLRTILAEALEGSGDFEVLRSGTERGPDPNAHHHAGTTPFSRDPRGGVVDPDGRVHGMENLYVVGASTFPTAGAANPTLTIVALALRLGRHLQGSTGT